jgi:tripartite-type tricarboxylate transporter receptor subunit TctC
MTLISAAIATGPVLVKDYPTFDLFDPICIVAKDPVMLSVKMDSRFKTAGDLISYAKASPGVVTVGHAGVGSVNHMGDVAFEKAIGTKFNLVPYKGTGPALVAGIGGHVDVSSSGGTEALTYVEGKKLRPLVVFATERSRLYPDVPIAKELGYDVALYQWSGVAVPKGTPEEVKAVLVEAFRKTFENEG